MSTPVPMISVCIANYNGEDCIAECIESVFAQQLDAAFEVIVHDDASDDKSVAIISSYEHVRLIRSEVNVGYCVSNNRMAEVARGDLVLLLNNDAVLMVNALENISRVFAENKRVGVVTLAQYDYESGALLDLGMRFDPFLNPVPITDAAGNEPAMVMGSCLAIPRSIWIRIGGFPEFFGSIAEDMYVCLFVRMLGYSLACAPKSGYRHRVGHSFGGGNIKNNRLRTSYARRALSERNKSFNMLLFFPLPLLIVLFPIHLMLLLIEGLALSALKLDCNPFLRIYLPVLPALCAHAHELIALRRRIFSESRIGYGKFLSAFSVMPRKLVLAIRHGIPRLK